MLILIKNTGLANRFAEEFKKSLHLAKNDERGSTTIVSAVDDDYRGMTWKRTQEKDIIGLNLNKSLIPNESAKFFITYTVKLPSNKFTSYGYDNSGQYYLKDWYLTPAVYDGKWRLYSNKNLEDQYTDAANTTIDFSYPKNLYLASNYLVLNNAKVANGQYAQLIGVNQKNCEIILSTKKKFTTHVTERMTIVTDIESSKFDKISQGISINRVTDFVSNNLGEYPHPYLLVSEIDYAKSPLYGLSQLPSFIRPYDEQFQFELKFLKTALNTILEKSLYLNPRKDQWLKDALVNYLMISYVDAYYPDQKLLGKLSKIWGVRSFHLAKMNFNEQYPLLSMFMARKNLDQPLATPNDSLLWFNQKIANRYKAGLGFSYLANYIGKDKVDTSIKSFFKHYKLSKVKTIDFESILKRSTPKDVDWFFKDYITSAERIDFKIKDVKKTDDSLIVTIKNKTGINTPISLFGMRNDSVISKYWFSNITNEGTFTIPRDGEDRLVLNYDHKIPEFNQRDNWKSLGGFLSSNKKVKLTFFKDLENPYYNQIFYVPVVSFNIYDGWSPGMRIHNKTFLERPFVYDFSPSYALREKAFVGYGKFNYRKYHGKKRFVCFKLSNKRFYFSFSTKF